MSKYNFNSNNSLDIDRIEYDATAQISDLQHGVCGRARGRAFAVEIKLRASLMSNVRV